MYRLLVYSLGLLFLASCRPAGPALETFPKRSLEMLLAVARDTRKETDERGPAMFQIFAEYIPADSSSKTVRGVFGGLDWLAESRVHMFSFQSGRHPMWVDSDSTLYRVDLFASDSVSSNWLMYIRLSGHRSEEDLHRFCGPEGDAMEDISLPEFALWKRDGGVEIIDRTGRRHWR